MQGGGGGGMGGIFQALFGGKSEHTIKQAEVEAARIRQEGNNKYEAQMTGLRRKVQDRNRQLIAKQAEGQVSVIDARMHQALDELTKAKAQDRIAASAAIGASVAGAAAAGVGGSTVDTYNRTIALSQAVSEQEMDRTMQKNAYWAGQNKAEVMMNAINSQDSTVYSAKIDNTVHLDHQRQKGGFGVLLAAAVGTAIGGPAVGMMAAQSAAQVSRAGYFQANAQPGMAMDQLGQAIDTGVGAFQGGSNFMSAKGSTWAGSFFQPQKEQRLWTNNFRIT